jgi:hypothetical protein
MAKLTESIGGENRYSPRRKARDGARIACKREYGPVEKSSLSTTYKHFSVEISVYNLCKTHGVPVNIAPNACMLIS